MAQQSNGGGEKTEKPSAKKLADAAKEGDLLQSRDLATALVMIAGAGWLAMMGPMLMQAMREMLVRGLQFGREDVIDFHPAERGGALLSGLWVPVGGIMLATVIAAIAAPAMLGSLGFRTSAFMPKASKLNPANGFKRMFGMNGLVELCKSIAKVLLMGSVGVWLIWSKLADITTMGAGGLESALSEVGSLFVMACIVMAGVLMVIAGVDVPWQMFQRFKRLAMSKQDLKDEHKESEGSPELKGHIRRRQMAVLSGSVRKAVSEATVVLMNPTHFAVALRYQPGKDFAPIVVARGCDAIAFAIKDLAETSNVPVLQYPALARAIYFTSRAGQVVDEALYIAVATILAFLYRVEHRMSGMSELPDIDLPDTMKFDADGKKTV
ncbi:MAG: flagellar type III secretion system protein FlhB [Sphingobium sp.]|jgi:flagellar biosynthetic protein FlhB|nr:flagellar type III secretion system protein FlhB [Sphingobium sp.]MCI1270108.1 flagellar type III secretion system protein FlhB [Sphingobium sp.]MCI1754965.1 flagellar type III secretion system protein FlhB [Sphingobium sp.]MCI2051710.1 flagellar type III secretion system protein FlhB [Sphingobium sp.]